MDTNTQTQSPTGQSPALAVDAWLAASELPPILPGHMREYLVTVEYRNGTRRVKLAHYANNHWLEWHDGYQGEDADEDGGKKWLGWLDVRTDPYGDELYMNVEGTVVAWMPKPAPFSR